MTVREEDCPGVFEIRCNCGYVDWTPWGAEIAEKIAREHAWKVGAPVR
jgi:hypothetical protein